MSQLNSGRKEAIEIANIKIVYGAPCSGKTTYVNEVITDRDIRFDYDDVLAAISNSGPHDNRAMLKLYGTEIRSLMLDLAKDDDQVEDAYIIACKITDSLLEQIGDTEVDYILISKTKEEVLEQLEDDDTREDKEYWKELIDDWYEWHATWSAANQSAAKEVNSLSKKRYYSLVVQDRQADIYVYGDIVSWPWLESDVSSYNLAQEIKSLDVDTINVYINSYGGEVAEGLAIYNALRRHDAKVKTYCDGFACSAASVVFMAGDERIMSNASLLMIHNAWLYAAGDPNQLRKQADDLETINEATKQAYLAHSSITEDALKQMMDDETWIDATSALEMGFATTIVDDAASKQAANQSVRKALVKMLLEHAKAKTEPEPNSDPEPEPDSEPDLEPQENNPQKLMAALFATKKER